MEPTLVEKCLAFCQKLANKKKVYVQAFCEYGCFPIYQGAFQSVGPIKKKSPSQMRREKARRNKYYLSKSIQVYVQETYDKKSSDKKKLIKY